MRFSFIDKKNWRKIPRLLYILSLLFLIRQYIYNCVNKYIIDEFHLSKVDSNLSLDFACFLLIGYYIYYLVVHIIKKRLVPTLPSLVSIAIFLTWYVITIRNSGRYHLVPPRHNTPP